MWNRYNSFVKRFRSAVVLLSVLIPASFAVAAPPAPGNNPQGLYNAALAAAKAGDYSRAVTLCRQTLKLSPDVAPVWGTLARLLAQQQRYSDAIVAAQKAVALAPKTVPFRADLANFYLLAEQRTEAATVAQKTLALDPKNDVALATLATCRLTDKRYKEAIPLLERLSAVRGGKDRAVSQRLVLAQKAIGDKAGAVRTAKALAAKYPADAEAALAVVYLALDNKDRLTTQNYITRLAKLAPQSPLPDYYRGLLALSDITKTDTERLRNGERAFQKAVNRSPTESILLAQLGYSQLGQDTKEKIEAARTNLMAAVLYANHDPVARQGLALVAEKERFWDDAAAQYEAVLQINPDDDKSRRRYAGVLRLAGRNEECYRQFYTLASRFPKDTLYLKELATYFIADKQFPKARGAYEQVLERDPKDADALLGIAQTYASENKKREARDAFERVIKASPKQETPYLLLAQMYHDDGADQESMATLERLLVAVPDSNAARWQLIEGYIAAKKDTEALAQIDRLTLKKGDPNNNRYRLAKGTLHLARERWSEAASEFERLVAEEPENPEFVLALADAQRKAGRNTEADANYERAARLAEAVLNRSPDDPSARTVLERARKAQNKP